MALGSIPPWLSITPLDYLHATQAGVQAGHAIAESTQRAWEEQQRMQMEQERQKQVVAQQAIENAMNRLAQDRLEAYRQAEVANRNRELGIQEKRLGSLDIAQQKADELARHNQAIEEAKLKQSDGKTYGEPVYADVPGIAGAKVAYRPGSPGLHLLLPPRGGTMTPTAAGNLLRILPEIERSTKMAGTNSLTAKYGPQLLSTALGGVGLPQPSPQSGTNGFKIISIKRRDQPAPQETTAPSEDFQDIDLGE